MPQPEYVIYEISPDGASVWMGNANNLQEARIRVTELAQNLWGLSPFMTREAPQGRCLSLRPYSWLSSQALE